MPCCALPCAEVGEVGAVGEVGEFRCTVGLDCRTGLMDSRTNKLDLAFDSGKRIGKKGRGTWYWHC